MGGPPAAGLAELHRTADRPVVSNGPGRCNDPPRHVLRLASCPASAHETQEFGGHPPASSGCKSDARWNKNRPIGDSRRGKYSSPGYRSADPDRLRAPSTAEFVTPSCANTS